MARAGGASEETEENPAAEVEKADEEAKAAAEEVEFPQDKAMRVLVAGCNNAWAADVSDDNDGYAYDTSKFHKSQRIGDSANLLEVILCLKSWF